MHLIDGSIRRPVTVFMTTLGVVLFRLVAASRLSVDLAARHLLSLAHRAHRSARRRPGRRRAVRDPPVEEAVGVVPGLVRSALQSRARASPR